MFLNHTRKDNICSHRKHNEDTLEDEWNRWGKGTYDKKEQVNGIELGLDTVVRIEKKKTVVYQLGGGK